MHREKLDRLVAALQIRAEKEEQIRRKIAEIGKESEVLATRFKKILENKMKQAESRGS